MSKKDQMLTLLREQADEHGAIRTEPEELRRKLGLSPHDFTKNLWDWRAQGLLTFPEDKNGSQIRPGLPIQLRIATRGGSKNNALHVAVEKLAVAINQLPWQSNGWREWDTARLRQLSGLESGDISGAMRDLRDKGKIVQLGGGKQGVRIQGVRWRGEQAPAVTEQAAPVESATNGAKAPSGPSQAVRDTAAYLKSLGHGETAAKALKVELPRTPELDKYLEAKRLAHQVSDDNPYIRVEFEVNLIAEEALAIRRALGDAG